MNYKNLILIILAFFIVAAIGLGAIDFGSNIKEGLSPNTGSKS